MNNNGIWSSTESIYVWFDANAGILHFRDGSFWSMGCISGGTEADAGTMYATQMEDANGNQVIINYQPGAGMGSQTNTSARIGTIEDVRGKGSATYTFTYNTDSTPHLTGITNSIGTPENYSFSTQPYSLDSPFSPVVSYGSTAVLASMTNNATGTSRKFSYDASQGSMAGSGELIEATMPDGGNLQWAYAPFTYSNGRTYREVQSRYLAMSAGATPLQYSFTHDDSGNPNATVHANTTLQDASGAQKEWIFYTQNGSSPGAWAMGLVSTFQNHYLNGSAGARDVNYTWTTDTAGNPYVSQVDTILDDGTPNAAQMRQTQAEDGYGNVTSASIYDYNNLTTPIQTWTNTYLHSQNSNYDNAYLRNLLVSSSVTDNNGHNATIATNTYDGTAPAAISGGTPQEWDTSRGTAFTIRGNLTQSASLGLTTTYTYDVTGHQLTGANSSGTGASATYSSATNWAAPDVLTPAAGTGDVQNGHTVTQAAGSALQNGYGYNSALSLVSTTMPNSATTNQNFNVTTGLLDNSTSVYGAQTAYSYVFNPTLVTATTNSHWAKSYRDGFGREIAHETGYGSTVVSRADTVYGACACSPLGKVVQVSQPYGINGATKITSDGTGNVAWTTYAYDSLGRTVSVTAADGSVTQYSYAGNAITITEPGGNWKIYTNNALGQLVTVTEPDPQYGQANNAATNFQTYYTYDLEGHLTSVQMPRPTGAGPYTQTRTFNYDLNTGRLTSTINPESGTISYTYYSDGLLRSVKDNKNQTADYSYDGYGRLAYVDRFDGSGTYDPCNSLTYGYDTSFGHLAASKYVQGRLSGVMVGVYPDPDPGAFNCAQTWTKLYDYTPGGLPTVITDQFSIAGSPGGTCGPNCYAQTAYDLNFENESYTYDNEGHMLTDGDLTYTLDSIGRPTAMVQNAGQPNVFPWVSGVAYGPSNEIHAMQYAASTGSVYQENRTYNDRLQLTSVVSAASGLPGINLTYNYPAAGANNGQIASMTDALSGEQVVYVYDSLNRLIQAQTTQSQTQYPQAPWWGQSFTYDAWGNMTAKSPTANHPGTTFQLSFDQTMNRVAPGQGFNYDGAGNTLNFPNVSQTFSYNTANQRSGYLYDYQNHPVNNTVSPVNTGNVNYYYGADGKRLGSYTVSSWNYCLFYVPATDEWIYIQYCGFTVTASRNIYFVGRLISSNGKTVLPDALGSIRADEAGNTTDYMPYGEEPAATSNDRTKFATYIREASTGLDYADQRNYASTYGRFATADPDNHSADLNVPNTWNRYAYVSGDPINANDPTGLIMNCGAFSVTDDTGHGCIPTPLDGLIVPYVGIQQLTVAEWDDVHPRVPRCPPVPQAPPGLDSGQIQKNIESTQAFFQSATEAGEGDALLSLGGYLVGQFSPHGPWDYKDLYSDPAQHRQATAFGNFNFGAVMEALGLSYYAAQNAAGVVQIMICVTRGACGAGVPGVRYPFGDQPGDAIQIEKGFNYQAALQAGCKN